MRLAVIGATGRTGTPLVRAAHNHDHEVTVLVRDPGRLDSDLAGRVRVVVGDSTDPDALRDLLSGADSVVSALGPTGKEPHLHARTAGALVAVMGEQGPRRFVGVSGAGIDVPGDQKGARDKIISKLVQTFGGAVVRDKPAEYAVWAASDLDWTLVRPPRLVDGPASSTPPEHDAHRSTASIKITRADLAAFLLRVVEEGLYVRQAPFVATAKA